MNLESIWLVTSGGEAQACKATVVSWHYTRSRAEIGKYRLKAKKVSAVTVERASEFVAAGGIVTICGVTYTHANLKGEQS